MRASLFFLRKIHFKITCALSSGTDNCPIAVFLFLGHVNQVRIRVGGTLEYGACSIIQMICIWLCHQLLPELTQASLHYKGTQPLKLKSMRYQKTNFVILSTPPNFLPTEQLAGRKNWCQFWHHGPLWCQHWHQLPPPASHSVGRKFDQC